MTAKCPKYVRLFLYNKCGNCFRYSNRVRRQEPQNRPKVFGLRLDKSSKEPSIDKDNGIPELLAKVPYTIRLFGENFDKDMLITFTENKGKPGTPCFMPTGGVFQVG